MIAFVLAGCLSTMAQTTDDMNRMEECRQNYRTLFGGEALTGRGTDPEMMDILQKFIFGEVFRTGDLTVRQREMITCITLATLQTLPQLKAHAGAALNVGVTPEELREVMYLTAPFIGFPKMLNAVATVNEVFKERGISLPLDRQGTVTEETRHATGKAIQDKLYPGGIASVMKGLPADMGKDVEQFLTDNFFGDIYSRGALDLPTRELLGYCVLTAMEAESQLHSHYHGNINVGNTPETLTAAVIQFQVRRLHPVSALYWLPGCHQGVAHHQGRIRQARSCRRQPGAPVQDHRRPGAAGSLQCLPERGDRGVDAVGAGRIDALCHRREGHAEQGGHPGNLCRPCGLRESSENAALQEVQAGHARDGEGIGTGGREAADTGTENQITLL